MPAYPALIWGGGQEEVSQLHLPNYLDMEHLNLGDAELVDINNGAIAITKSYVLATAGTTGVTNQIWTITGGDKGSILVLRCATSTTIRDNTANLRLPSDFVMDHSSDTIVLIRLSSGGNWLQLARANNG